MRKFNEDTRVKIPATIHFMKLGYKYLPKNTELHDETRIVVSEFHSALEKINNKKYSHEEVLEIVNELYALSKINDKGASFYNRLINPVDKPKIIDFDCEDNNTFAVINELIFGNKGYALRKNGSFRPDVNALINGIPLGFLEAKRPNNEGGIQAEFNRMRNVRLSNPDFQRFFNMIQIATFSNNMEYENDITNSSSIEHVKAGSFYTTPNGQNTTFSYFREEDPKKNGFLKISDEEIKNVLIDNGYDPEVANTPEFNTNLDINTPCNSFISSMFDKKRFLFFLKYGIVYVNGDAIQKHIMRYPQFFASQAMVKWFEVKKTGIIWHTQGSGKTELACMSIKMFRDIYAKKEIIPKFYYVVDRLDLLNQVSKDMTNRGVSIHAVACKSKFADALKVSSSVEMENGVNGGLTVVNIQKFSDEIPTIKNEYDAKVQRIFFIDEAHRSYKSDGEFYKNLMLADPDGIYIALTGTPLLSEKEKTTLKFDGYIHKYFYDKSIADGFTLKIKRESIRGVASTKLKKLINVKEEGSNKKEIYESDEFVNGACEFIDEDFAQFRFVNDDDTVAAQIVCYSTEQAKKVKKYFDENSNFKTALIISNNDVDTALNKENQNNFRDKTELDIIIVHQMLTTGYDVNRLKKQYLLRFVKDHNLLQTITRVNRPHKNPKGVPYRFGYIVDFVDILDEFEETREMYIKELEASAGDENTSIENIVVDIEQIYKEYKLAFSELNKMHNINNLEIFSREITHSKLEDVEKAKKIIDSIKSYYVEFKLSKKDSYAEEVNISHIKELSKIVQDRINLCSSIASYTKKTSYLSNSEYVDIDIKFVKVSETILNLERFNPEELGKIKSTLDAINKEFNSSNYFYSNKMITLEDLLRKALESVGIENIDKISERMKKILADAKKHNEEINNILKRYENNKAFMKTFIDATDNYQELKEDDLLSVLDIIYESTKEIKDSSLLTLQSESTFTNHIKSRIIPSLCTSKLLHSKISLTDLNNLLCEIYTNMKTF